MSFVNRLSARSPLRQQRQQRQHRVIRLLPFLAFAALAGCEDSTAPALGAPTGVSVTAQSPTTTLIAWNAVSSATEYEVERALGDGAFASVATVDDEEYADDGLVAETDYRYRVRALRGTSQGPFSLSATVRTSDRTVVQVTADVTTNTTWTADNLYQLTRVISVANGATLEIQPGTKIIGGPVTSGQAPPVTALIVLRGARIDAVGTPQAPIIFSSSAPPGQRSPGDWGGLILVGNASSNRTGRTVVEGPPPADTVSWNAGTQDNDNSGELAYTRVEFAGAAFIVNVELNSYSYYAVGRGTRNEYNQAIRGLDDMFEWFGGTVDGRYLVSYESGDDHFDAAEGYRGRNQFIIGLQTGPRVSPRPGNPGALSGEQNGFETDGCGSTSGTCAIGYNSTPFNMPVFANFTVVGPGPGILPVRAGGDGGVGLLVRRGTGGVWMNGVVARWPEAGLSVFDPETSTKIDQDSLNIINTVFADNNRTYDEVGASNRFGTENRFAASNNTIVTATQGHSLFANVPAAASEVPNEFAFDWRPAVGSALVSGGTGATLPGRVPNRVGSFFGSAMQGTTYRGAVAPGDPDPWYLPWTTYYRN